MENERIVQEEISRLEKERDELAKMFIKIMAFITKPAYQELSDSQKVQAGEHLVAMLEYNAILNVRILGMLGGIDG